MKKISLKKRFSELEKRSIILGTVLLLVFLIAGFRFADYLYQDAAIVQLQETDIETVAIDVDDNAISEYININQATFTQLQKLSGIGEVKAQTIIDYRKKHGNFASIEELMKVDGIGPVTYEKISELICVE